MRKYILLSLCALLICYILFQIVNNQSPLYNEWLDKKAYAQLKEELTPFHIEELELLFLPQRRLVFRYDTEVFQDMTYDSSLWKQRRGPFHGPMTNNVVTVYFHNESKERLMFFVEDPDSDRFTVSYRKRRFIVQSSNLKMLLQSLEQE